MKMKNIFNESRMSRPLIDHVPVDKNIWMNSNIGMLCYMDNDDDPVTLKNSVVIIDIHDLDCRM